MTDTLAMIAERVIRDLSGGDIPSDSPYKMEFVIAHVRDTIREDWKLEMLNRRGGGEDDRTAITQYIATFPNIEVKIETSTFRAYIDLPSNYTSMKFNRGVFAISRMNQPNKRMIPVANPGVTSQLPHGDFERDNFGYYTEGLKSFFTRDIKKDGIDKVLLKLLVPAPDTWGINDPLPIIPENLGKIMDIIKMRVQNKFPNDRLNDNNPNPRAANA